MSDGASDHRGCSGPRGCGPTCRANCTYADPLPEIVSRITEPPGKSKYYSAAVSEKIRKLNALLGELEDFERAEEAEIFGFQIIFKLKNGVTFSLGSDRGTDPERILLREPLVEQIKGAVRSYIVSLSRELKVQTGGK